MFGSEQPYSPSTPSTPPSPDPPRARTSPSITPSPLETSQTKRSRSISQQSPIPDPKRSKRSLTDNVYDGFNPTSGGDCGISPNNNNSSKSLQVKPGLQTVLSHLATPLQPLVSVTTGLPHPDFPMSLLQYHVLTTDQLDCLAKHYHQFYPPAPETYGYPLLIKPWVGLDQADIEVKRRRFGRFIGLGGCESPISTGVGMETETEEQILERMDREWYRALMSARQEEGERAARRKWGLQ